MTQLYHHSTTLSTSVDIVNDEEFRHWLKRQLRRREWSQSEFARRLGTAPGVVSHWVRGDRVPDPASCDRIADVLGVDVDLVLTLAGHRPAVEPLAPDDERRELLGYLKRLQLTPDRVTALRGVLRGWLEADLRERERRGS